MIIATQVKVGFIINLSNVLYRVLKVNHVTPGKGNAQVQVDIRNLSTGIKNNRRFRPSDSIEKVETDERNINYLYQEGSIYHFMDPKTYEQFELSEQLITDAIPYLKPEAEIILMTTDDKPISVSLPRRAKLKVIDCDPASKGIAGATKAAKVDSGATFKVPLFIKRGQEIIIDTESGTYLEKA